MKKRLALLLVIALLASNFSFGAGVEYATNLLVNGEGESIEGWIDPNGDLWGSHANVTPHSGTAFLWPVGGARGTDADEESYIYSDISLLGYNPGETAVLTAWLANYDQSPHDRATIKLSLLDAGGNVLVEDYRMQRDPQWNQHTINLVIPQGAVTARVTLIATRFVGSNNDAYFDAMTFMVQKSQYDTVAVTGDKKFAKAGEMVQCVANNGVTKAPSAYQWSTSYSQAATVDANGLVTMLTDDEVGVYAKDLATGLTGVYWINSDKKTVSEQPTKPSSQNTTQSSGNSRAKNDTNGRAKNDVPGVNDAFPELTFTDLPRDHWAYEYVKIMSGLGIISGYPDNTFRPNDTFSRAAFAKLLTLSAGLDVYEGYDVVYRDVQPIDWFYQYVMAAEQIEAINYYNEPDGSRTYRPNVPSEREDVAVALVSLLGLDPKDADLSLISGYKDYNSISRDMRPYVALAYEYEIMRGDENGYFSPHGPLTRAQACKVFAVVLLELSSY